MPAPWRWCLTPSRCLRLRLRLRVPGTEQVVFVGLAAGGGTRDLRIVDVASATERAVAALALGAPCLPEAYAALDEDPPDVDVFDADDLWLSDSGKHACIVTSDGSPNARTFEEVHVVKLATGDVQRVLTFGGDECGRHSGEMPGACERVRNDSDDDDDDDDEPKPSAIGGVVDSVSPNGRWQLVLLASALGDVVHCQYALYRPSTAKSFPVASSPGKWPAAISPPVPRGVDAGEGEYIEGYPEFESAPTAWVGPHHLVIGRTLVVAGHRVITLPGDLVR